MDSEHNTSQPEPPTAAGVEPVAWQERQARRMRDGVVTEWSNWYDCKARNLKEARATAFAENLISYEWRPLYATPPALTDAQCDAARYRDTLKEIADMTFDPWTNGAKAGELALRALIRAAAAGGA